jgi:xanthine dehydrogenase accessory factor
VKDILSTIEKWRSRGERVVTATVVSMVGSAPRLPGARLAVNERGELTGSVSGGCVEPAVVQTAMEVMQHGRPQMLEFGITEADNIEQIGLACGGTIRVFVARDMPELYEALYEALNKEQGIAMATLVSGPAYVGAKLLVYPDHTVQGTLGLPTLDGLVIPDAEQAIWRSEPRIHTYVLEGTTMPQSFDVFIEGFPPSPELIIIGAGHIAISLTTIAKALHYHVVIIDARAAFATRERFPHADELIVAWPDEILQKRPLYPSTSVAVLTHDPKFDEPTLRVLLARQVGYVGAIGSRTTSRERAERLKREGIPEEQITRIHGPIGLEIGATSPEEIALAIMAEIVAVRHGKEHATRHAKMT